MFKVFPSHILMSIVFGNIQFSFEQSNRSNQTMKRYDECGGYLVEDQALIATPNYPKSEKERQNAYSSNMNCVWEKTTPFNNTLYRFKFLDMVLENRPVTANSSETKCFDYLNISIASIGTKQFCSWKAPDTIFQGKGPNMTVVFSSNEKNNYRGAVLAYQATPNHDPCKPNPCVYGQCYPRSNDIDFTCSCLPGYTGYRCEIDIDECASEPCQNGGTCRQPSAGVFACDCSEGFEGEMCERVAATTKPPDNENPVDGVKDPCQSNPCGRFSIKCESYGDTFSCICLSSYTGELCDVKMSECDSEPCMNDGACIDDGETFVCFCTKGWTGTRCDVKLDACLSNPCEDYEVCESENEDEFKCKCPKGSTGARCHEDINECASDPCHNGGSCSDDGRKDFYKCSCKKGFIGVNCEIVIPFCENPGIPFVENDTKWKPGETLQFHCAEGYKLLGTPNLTCQNDTKWTGLVPVCVDNQNKTVLYLPSKLSPQLIFLISLASALTVVLLIFSTWLLLKGPWKIGQEVTKVMKLSRISLTSY